MQFESIFFSVNLERMQLDQCPVQIGTVYWCIGEGQLKRNLKVELFLSAFRHTQSKELEWSDGMERGKGEGGEEEEEEGGRGGLLNVVKLVFH